MLYAWVKTVVGALLSANFAVPLVTVVSNRHLWDEPMAVLAGNMSLTSTLLGIFIMLIGIYDVAHFQNAALCQFLQYNSFGFGIAFKMAQVCAAVDQFVAVIYTVNHYPIMMRVHPWLFIATWLTWAAQIIFGFFAHTFDMETISENVGRQGNRSNVTYTGCRWEMAMADVFTILGELQWVTLSLVTASLFVYTGLVGHRSNAWLVREEQRLRQSGGSGGENQTFFSNYRAFKKIIAVLSLTVTLDIISPVLRISSRWYPQPLLNGLLHQARLFCFIFEGWAYGLLNAKLRAAYKKMLCGRSNRVASLREEQGLQRGQRVPPGVADAPLELQSVEN